MTQLRSTDLRHNPRYQAAARTSQRTGPALSVTPSVGPTPAEGWTWVAIAVLCVAGLAVVGLAQ